MIFVIDRGVGVWVVETIAAARIADDLDGGKLWLRDRIGRRDLASRVASDSVGRRMGYDATEKA